MPCAEYLQDKSRTEQRRKELGSLEYQCRTCTKNGKCHGLKVFRTHIAACSDYQRK